MIHKALGHAPRVRTEATAILAVVITTTLAVAAESGLHVTPSVDYDGHAFVTNTAPGLRFERRNAPGRNGEGIDYEFPEQTAHGVALLARFPAFKLSDRRIHVDGPWYDTAAANLHFTRGITSIGAIPRYREREDAPTNVRNLSQLQKWSLLTDPLWYAAAARLVRKLEKEDSADPRIPALRFLSEKHCYTNDEAAYRALGRYTFESERWPTDRDGEFVGYAAIDIETTEGFVHQRNCNGWLYQGMAESARARGLRVIPMLYGQWQFSVGCFYESMRQGGHGEPEYLRPEKDFLAGPDPTLVACQDNDGILSMDGYQQAIWGHEPFYQRDPDGSLQLHDGQPAFSDLRRTEAYGQTLKLEKGEARQCLDNIYRTALRMYLQHHRRAGQYPADSSLTKPFLANCKIGAWSRYTNEGLQGIQQNDRPLPGWLLELLIGLYLFTADDVTLWSSDMNFHPGPLGGDYTSAWRYNAHGVLESVVKAAHRYSALDPLHATGARFQWCWFNLPVANKNETAGDRYYEKPLAIGKLRPFEGHIWLELFVAWPTLDATATEFQVWIDQDGRRSPSSTVRLQNGRSYFYDAWQLPDEFSNLEGRHVWLRATDLMGVTRTWRGDWRAPVNGAAAAPAGLR